MLKIVLQGKGKSSVAGRGAKPLSGDRVTVACPDHLVLADLPVAKSIGSVPATSRVKTIGCRVHRRAGEKVHFCVCCDFPIAIYGRLSPCEHAFCLDCARSGSNCHICEQRIQKIQAIKREEGIFICGNQHCRKSFLEKTALQTHIQAHISEINATADFTTVHDGDEKDQCLQPESLPLPKSVIQPNLPPPASGQIEHHPSESQPGSSRGFDGLDQISNKQKGILSETPIPEYLMHYHHPPNVAVPYDLYSVQAPPLSCPPFTPGGGQPLYGVPMVHSNYATEVGSGPASGLIFSGRYPQPWNTGPVDVPFFQGDGGYPGVLPSNLPPPYSTQKGMELAQTENSMGPTDGMGTFAPPSMWLQPPPSLPPPHMSQLKQGNFFPRDEGQAYGWQNEKRDGFGNGQD